ncbi:MAG TPA: hypothetical protein VGO49_21920 [Bradyrhizobium sp.]|jgi:hypothetical protein|nr:hypothetical protein [Bradyrhizobium sp.]
MDELEKKKPVQQAILDDQMQSLLRKLAGAAGYQGNPSDLEELKRRSIELKRDPVGNREAIALLDSAISSHADEIGSALSTRSLAATNDPGTDIYPRFVRQKLAFLGSDKAKFYDRGPFEIIWRSLLVTTLESQYFLEQQAESNDKEILRKAIRVLDEILDRRRRPEYDYISNRQEFLVNTDLFWRASLLFVLGEKPEMQKLLNKLVQDNKDFGLKTVNSNHIYVYKTFNFPHQIIVQDDLEKNGTHKAEIKDPYVLDRYYNAAQLALYACAYFDQAGPKRIDAFVSAVEGLALSDYYVVAASTDSSAKLQELASLLKRAADGAAVANERNQLIQQITSKEMPGFSDAIKRGAMSCDIKDDVRDQVYSKFDFQITPAHIEGFGKATEYLLVGGRLNAGQANAAVNFFNKSVFPALGPHPFDKTELRTYAARMRIGQ